MAVEAVGVNLKARISHSERNALRQAITYHLVLYIRGQDLSPAELAEASNLFGKPKTFVLRNDRIDDAPEVSIVSNRPPLLGGKLLVQAKHWHTNDSYLAEPATLTLLHAVTLPGAGGDTEFINC
jgi:taurine dioxygenase